jgi:membrane associated rhomboid family serine protease
MTDPAPAPLDAILHLVAKAAPQPWYPRDYFQATGTPRGSLEPGLEQLRLGGLIRLTEWVEDHGQGYVLTPEGQRALWNPRELSRLSRSDVRPAAPRVVERDFSGPTTWDRGEAIRASLLGPFTPAVTFVLLALNVTVFLAGLTIAQREGLSANDFLGGRAIRALHQTGALSIREVLRGEWWRLLTCCFVHIGWLHIGVNMYALFGFGQLIERLFGHWRYLAIYLVSGFGGSCLGVLVLPNFDAVLAGASGALCGLLGAMGAWAFLNRNYLPSGLVASMRRNLMINALLLVFISAMPGISWGAHLGGAVCGLLAAALLNVARFGHYWQRALAWLGVLALPAVCFGAVFSYGPYFNESWAIVEINQKYLPEVDRLDKAADKEIQAAHVTRLIYQTRAQRRNPEAVQEAIEALKRARADLDEAIVFLERAGPYRSQRVTRARQLLLELLRERDKLFGMYQECLEQGQECAQDDHALQEQEQKIRDLNQEYDKATQPG